MNTIQLPLLALVIGKTSGHGHHSAPHDPILPHHVVESDAFIRRLQNHLFPFGPRYNSILATLIIQIMPCIVIQMMPGLRNGANSPILSILVAFALGTLLGDVLLHMIPEVFEGVNVDSVNPHRDQLILNSAIFAGFLLFLFLDKSIRILSQNDAIHSHSHSHSHLHEKEQEHETSTSPLLNVVTSFIHNATDGIALASSFYNSKHVGTTTTLAVIFHEIPHELGDFAILLTSGFSFPQALKSQFVTSLGAIMGTAIGCALNEIPKTREQSSCTNSSLLLLSITTGGFLYLSTVGVVPQLLQSYSASPKDKKNETNKGQEFRKWLIQLSATLVGFMLMFHLALQE